MATREQLAALRRSGRIDAFVDAASRHLAATGNDPETALLLLQAYVELHLGAAARDLLVARRDLAADPALRGAVEASIAALPDGRIAADRIADQRRRATGLLGSDLARWLEAETADEEAIHRSRDGHLHLGRRGDDGAWTWPGGFALEPDPRAFTIPPTSGQPHVPMLLGCPMGRLLERTIEESRTQRGRSAVPVYLLEPLPERFRAWLGAASRRAALAEPRLRIFVGPDALADYERTLLDRLGLPAASILVPGREDEPLAERVRVIHDRVAVERDRRAQADLSEILARDRTRDGADLAARLVPGATILGVTSRHTTMLRHSMRDIGAALETAGFRFVVAEEPAEEEWFTAPVVADLVRRHDPALIVLINHLRAQGHGLFGATPLLTWVQDPTDEILCAEAGASIGAIDFVAGFYRQQAVERYGYPAERYAAVGFFPVSTRLFHDAPLPEAERDRWRCDVCYVGHAQGDVAAFVARLRERYPAEIHALVDAIAAASIAASAAPGAERTHPSLRAARAIVDAACATIAPRLPDRARTNLANYLAFRVLDLAFRTETLGWVAAWARSRGARFHLYGEGWSDDPRFAEFARGPVAHGEEARRAYRGAAVALQTIPSGLVHQRTFEALCCGAEVVGRWCPDDFGGLDAATFRAAHGDGATFDRILWREGFRDLDRDVFATEEELAARLDAALADPAARRARVAARATIVRARFSYDAVVPGIVGFVREGLAAAPTLTAVAVPAAPSG